MKKLFALLTIFVCGCGFMIDSGTAIRAAQDEGYTNVVITSEHYISPQMMGGCSDSDNAGFEMNATNPRGTNVHFTVCCGWPFKGCTIRH